MSEPMTVLGQRIKTLVEKGDNMLASASVCAREARDRFDAGEKDGCATWGQWWTDRTGLSDRRGRYLLAIGRADDPQAAAQLSRKKNRSAVAKHRARKAELRNSVVARATNLPTTPKKPPASTRDESNVRDLDELHRLWNAFGELYERCDRTVQERFKKERRPFRV